MTPHDILIVEDEAITASDLKARLERWSYHVTTVDSGERALSSVRETCPDLVLMDIRLSDGLDGIDAANQIRSEFQVPIVFMTALFEQELLERAKTAAPYGYILKPIQDEELQSIVQIAHHHHQLDIEQARALAEQRRSASELLDSCTEVLAKIIAVAAPHLSSETARLTEYVLALAEAAGISDCTELEVATKLANVGYLLLPPTLVQKERAGLNLSVAERDMLSRVPQIGRDLLAELPPLRAVAEIVYYQDKNFDGTGFPPDRTNGVEIPIGARLLKVARDIRMLERSGTPRSKILEEMATTPGRHDPALMQHALTAIIDTPPPGARPIKLKELAVGQVLAAPIETMEGTVLMAAGTRISHALLLKIANFAEHTPIHEPVYVQVDG